RRCDRARPRPSLRRARPRAERRPLEHFGWDWPGDVDSGVSFLERQGVRHVGVLGLSPCGGRADIGFVTSPSPPLDGVVGKIAPRPLLLIQSNDPAERALAPVRAHVDWRPGVLWHVDATHTKGLASHPAAYRGQGARALPASAASVAPELEQPLVADAEVVSQLVQDDAADLRGQLRRVAAGAPLDRPAVDRDFVRQRERVPLRALREWDALVEPEQAPARRRLVLDDDLDVRHGVSELIRQRVDNLL